ncbi:MAG: 2-dehydro-3-deoxygalactonokinase [Burkholderiaceae bacterium]
MSSAASEPVLIGLDWGTSSARAYLIGGHGDVLDSVSTGRGIMQIVGREFESACGELLARWRDLLGMPVVASGMITSRQGWIETPYLPLPAGSDALAHALVAHRTASGIELHFVGGLVTQANGA